MVVRDTKHPEGNEDTMTTSTGKKLALVALVACIALASMAFAACSTQSASSSATASESASDSEPSTPVAADSQATAAGTAASATLGAVANTLAQNEEALVAEYADKFTQETYADADTGLSVTYNLFLPQGYDASESYPMVVFIADSSCAKGDAEQSLTQGLGALDGRMAGRLPVHRMRADLPRDHPGRP